MPIWLTLIFALPQMYKFVKDLIAIWREMRGLPARERKQAEAEFKNLVQECKNGSCSVDKKRMIDEFRKRISQRLDSR